MNDKRFPQAIRRAIAGKPCRADSTGMSGATVLLFDDRALKIEKTGLAADNEYLLLQWLEGRLPVPRVLAFERQDGFNYLLMTRLCGDMACSDACMRQPERVTDALADGLSLLWQVDIGDCPVSNGLTQKLLQAQLRIDGGLVDVGDFNPNTLGAGGFADVEALYQWLLRNRPETEDTVFSHGDYCLPNLFITAGKPSGFLDLGGAGMADRWQDIALCLRSLEYNMVYLHNFSQADFCRCRARLFDRLCLPPDEERMRYLVLLDELF